MIEQEQAEIETQTKIEYLSTIEKDYIDICFIDLTDKSSFESKLGRDGIIDSYIKIDSVKSTNTFQSSKEYYFEIYEKMNIIEDAILKIKLKYPHCNISIQVNETHINLKIIL